LFEEGANELSPERKALREAVIKWQTNYNLLENENEKKWVLHWIISNALNQWAISPSKNRKHIVLSEIKVPGLTLIKLAQDKINNEKLFPPRGLPEYKPFDESRDAYIKRINLKRVIRKRIESDDILSIASNKSKSSFISQISDVLLKDVISYCKKVEKAFIASEWKWEFKEGMDERIWFWRPEKIRVIDRWILTPTFERLTRDLIWTVRAQIQGKSYSEIATKGKIEDSKEFEGKIIPYSKLTKDHFDITEINRSTVRSSVLKILSLLKLKPKERLGRPKGKKDSESAKIQRNLGK
jgi:hypothetical protein